MEKIIKKRLIESAEIKERIAAEGSGEIADITGGIINCYKAGGKVVLFRNGGSSADAQHLAAELVGRFNCYLLENRRNVKELFKKNACCSGD